MADHIWEEFGFDTKEEYEQAMADHNAIVESTSQTIGIVTEAITKLFEYGVIVIPTREDILDGVAIGNHHNPIYKGIDSRCFIIYSFQSTIDEELQLNLLETIKEKLNKPRYQGRYIIDHNIIKLANYDIIK